MDIESTPDKAPRCSFAFRSRCIRDGIGEQRAAEGMEQRADV